MGTGYFPGVKYGRGVLLNSQLLLGPRSWKSRAIPLPTLWATLGLQRETFTFLLWQYVSTIYRIYSRNSRNFLTKILYLNLGCVIYARKRFYVNKSGYTGNFLNILLEAWITRWRELREKIQYYIPQRDEFYKIKQYLGRGGVRQNTTVLCPIYYAGDDMFRPLWAIFESQKYM